MKMKYLILISFAIYLAFAAVNYFYLSKITDLSVTLYILAAVVIGMPSIIVSYLQTQKMKDMEKNFPAFLQDFVEAIRGGMTLPQAFKAIAVNHYGQLTPLVRKMSAQLDWGISVEIVLLNFGEETKSRLIKRIVSTVMESHKFGGKLIETFEALSTTALEVERLRAERKLLLNSQIVTGYIIFFVFLAVLIGLQKYLVPSLGQVSASSLTSISGGGPAQPTDLTAAYGNIFRNLILIQGLFAGLTVGKMAEGAAVSGIKHSIFMMTSGLLVFLLVGT